MKRKAGLFLIFGAVIPLAVASAAWACGVLSTLTLNTKTASPGASVTAVGVNYSAKAGASPVTIHLATRTGKVLATTVPDAGGHINATFPIPASTRAGWYVVMATQSNPDGSPKAGTPGRTTLRVQAAGKSHNVVAVSPWSTANPAGPAASVAHEAGGSGSPALMPMLLAVVLSLALLMGGLTLAGGRRNRATNRLPLGV